MPAQISVVPQDHSQRWILVPGVASTRQIEIRNDSDAPVECHLRVEEPSSASASPAVLTIQPRHSRTADIIFLANWSPTQHRRVSASVRDSQGNLLATFAHEIVAAESSDCSLSLDWKEEILVKGALAGFKLWCAIASRSATPRRFEIDFSAHPALRFPERKTVMLAAGESAAFEVPVAWNRSVRDVAGLNHPRTVEVFVPVSEGRRTAALSWELIEKHLAGHLTADDREPKQKPADLSAHRPPSYAARPPGQLKYTELLELKKLEQGVVGGTHARTPLRSNDEVKGQEPLLRRVTMAPLVSIALALIALAVAAFYWYPSQHKSQLVTAPVRVSATPTSPVSRSAQHSTGIMGHGPLATPAWMNVATATVNPAPPNASSQRTSTVKQPVQRVALAPQRKPAPVATVDRNAIVALSGVGAAYTSRGRAVNVVWSSTAQARALVELLDTTGKVIASRSVTGSRSDSTVRLPHGYHGSVSVEVTAIGYHGERAVQGASLAPPG